MTKLNLVKFATTYQPIDFENMNEDQVYIYYAMLESLGYLKVGIEQLEQTDASNFMIKELNELHLQLESVISQAVPGNTGKDVILSAIEPVEDYIFRISESLSKFDYYQVLNVHNALDTMYQSLGSLKSMTETYYPAKEVPAQPGTAQPETARPETTEPEVTESEVTESEIIEAVQVLEQKETKKKTINDALNEIAYTAIYIVLKQLKSYGYTDLATNEDVKNQCYIAVLTSFTEIMNESILSEYINKETLEEDARYVTNYYFDQLTSTIVEWG
jgi:hypothetical protein